MSSDAFAEISAVGGFRSSNGEKLSLLLGQTQLTFNKEIICFLSPLLSSILRDMSRDCCCCANGHVFISLPPEMSPTAVLPFQKVLENGVSHNLDGHAREQLEDTLGLLGMDINSFIIQDDDHEANERGQFNESIHDPLDLGMWDLDNEDDYFDVKDIKIEIHNDHKHEDLVQTKSGDAENSKEMTADGVDENDQSNNNNVLLGMTKNVKLQTLKLKVKTLDRKRMIKPPHDSIPALDNLNPLQEMLKPAVDRKIREKETPKQPPEILNIEREIPNPGLETPKLVQNTPKLRSKRPIPSFYDEDDFENVGSFKKAKNETTQANGLNRIKMSGYPNPKRLKVDRNSLHSLVPDELWLKMFRYLDIEDLSMMGATSRRFNTISKDSSLPQSLVFDWRNVKASLEGVNAVIDKATKVERMRFTNKNMDKVNDMILASLVEKAKDTLNALVFAPEIVLSNRAVDKFQCLTHLEVLDISANKLHSVGVNAIAKMKNLKELKIPWCEFVSETTLTQLFQGLKNLMLVDLTKCKTGVTRGYCGVTNGTVKTLAKNNPNLEHLNLSFCELIGNDAVKDLNENCVNLKYLNLMGCTMLGPDGFNALAKCKKLQHLSLASIIGLTDSALLNIVNSCNQLKHINLNRCKYISKEAIENIVMTSKGLTSINISGIKAVSVQFIHKLRKEYPRLVIC